MACTRGSRSGEPARSQAVRRASIARSAAYLRVPATAGPPSGASVDMRPTASGRRIRQRLRPQWVGTCRPMPAEADADGAPTMTHGPVLRALGDVRRLWMYSSRTPGQTTKGRFRRRLPLGRQPLPAADSLFRSSVCRQRTTADGRDYQFAVYADSSQSICRALNGRSSKWRPQHPDPPATFTVPDWPPHSSPTRAHLANSQGRTWRSLAWHRRSQALNELQRRQPCRLRPRTARALCPAPDSARRLSCVRTSAPGAWCRRARGSRD